MNKAILKSIRESLFLGQVLVGVVFLLDYSLVLSLFKHRGVRVFLNQKNEESKQKKLLK